MNAFSLALGLVVAGACCLVIWRAVRVPIDLRVSTCGACGYELAPDPRGLGKCPECGRELLEVGIVSPAMRLRKRRGMALPVIALGVLIWLSLAGLNALLWSFPANHFVRHTGQIAFMSAGPPTLYWIDLSCDLTGFLSRPDGTVTIQVRSRSPAQAVIDVKTWRVRSATVPGVAPGTVFSKQEVESLYAGAGLDPKATDTAEDIGALDQRLKSVRADPSSLTAAASFTRTRNAGRLSVGSRSTGTGGQGVGIAALGITPTDLTILTWLYAGTAFTIGCYLIWLMRRPATVRQIASGPLGPGEEP